MKSKEDYFYRVAKNLLVGGLLMICFACGDKNKVASEIAETDINLEVIRFDREFAESGPSDIPNLKHKYPFLFPPQYTDSIWEAKLSDTLQISLHNEVDMVFGGFKEEADDLELLFKHIHHYFPKYNIPKVITLTSDVDYNNRIILTDSLLLIGLDNYLGNEHRFYAGIQSYIASGLDKRFLVSDVAGAFVKKVIPRSRDRSFLSKMVYYGKELYVKEKLMPASTDGQKIGYSEAQLAWAQANEEQIWRYLIERELLYSTDNKLDLRFLDPAPFSKFRLELDNESPGRIGRYMGWQIVRAFMDNNDLSLQQLLNISAEEIFRQANYKPKRY
ncbi:gliding motility lipoprotein GldB [Spongiimicrobium sp. 3-5]|uniref:gliding motility lipoprotein GldB n=1 Tax=Spongiimicrobium sp. 3-5 TaxID=3332596 RepID=UPI00398027C3